MKYDTSHNSPFDRGGADSYYQRPPRPHYWKTVNGKGIKIEEKDMTPEEVQAYLEGYEENERRGDFKEWD